MRHKILVVINRTSEIRQEHATKWSPRNRYVVFSIINDPILNLIEDIPIGLDL